MIYENLNQKSSKTATTDRNTTRKPGSAGKMASEIKTETVFKTKYSQNINSSALEKELKKTIAGEVRFDNGSIALYSTDASNYRQIPIGVVLPKTETDIINTIAACRKYG